MMRPLLVVLALCAKLTLGAPSDPIEKVLGSLTLRQKAAQLLVVKHVGKGVSPSERRLIQRYGIGGLVVFGDAIGETAQIKKLTRELQANSAVPLFIAIDHEGGRVNRLRGLTGKIPSAKELGAGKDLARIRRAGGEAAALLGSLGLNVNLAPVLDLERKGMQEALRDRAFSAEANDAAEDAAAYLQGLESGGKVIGVVKHFPGLGETSVDPHLALPVIPLTAAAMRRRELAAYRSLFRLGHVRAVMIGNASYPALDPTRPAGLSKIIVETFLRNELGFDGLVVTDSLSVPPLRHEYPLEEAAVLALRAGVDMVLGATGPAETGAIVARLERAVEAGELSEKRLDVSVRRVLRLKHELGLL